jgi:hypothetical protein
VDNVHSASACNNDAVEVSVVGDVAEADDSISRRAGGDDKVGDTSRITDMIEPEERA